jgi:hypothetical protein
MSTRKSQSSYERTKTTINISAPHDFKDEVIRLAAHDRMTISEFVRQALGEAHPKLRALDRGSMHARNMAIKLRGLERAQKEFDDVMKL